MDVFVLMKQNTYLEATLAKLYKQFCHTRVELEQANKLLDNMNVDLSSFNIKEEE